MLSKLKLSDSKFWAFLLGCFLLSFLLISLFFSAPARGVDQLKGELLNAFEARREQVSFEKNKGIKDVNLDAFQPIIEAALEESDDYYRYTIDSWDIRAKGDSRRTQININISYLSSLREDEYVFRQTERIAENLFAPGMDEHQKVKAVNDYLITRIEYDETLLNKTAYDALKTETTTCQGYALLTYLFLKQAGIENQIITGQLQKESENHAWNLVNLNGSWYHLDVTQNAAHYPEQEALIYGWYNLSDEAISSTHSWQTGDYPPAEKNYLEELKRSGVRRTAGEQSYEQLIRELNLHYFQDEYTVFDYQDLEQQLEKALVNKKRKISFRTTQDLASSAGEMLRTLYARQPDLPAIESYSLEQVNYNRDRYNNTVLLKINFHY